MLTKRNAVKQNPAHFKNGAYFYKKEMTSSFIQNTKIQNVYIMNERLFKTVCKKLYFQNLHSKVYIIFFPLWKVVFVVAFDLLGQPLEYSRKKIAGCYCPVVSDNLWKDVQYHNDKKVW